MSSLVKKGLVTCGGHGAESTVRLTAAGFAAYEQVRAARALLAWSQQRLADEVPIGIVTVHQIEAGKTRPHRSTLVVIRRAFERAGVTFIDADQNGGPGVRLAKGQTE